MVIWNNPVLFFFLKHTLLVQESELVWVHNPWRGVNIQGSFDISSKPQPVKDSLLWLSCYKLGIKLEISAQLI